MMYFKKKIFFLVIIFFSISSISFSEIVKDIKVKGNERVSDKSIEMFSNINIGDDVDQDQLNQILKNVYDSNFFKDAECHKNHVSKICTTAYMKNFRFNNEGQLLNDQEKNLDYL